MPIRGLNEFLRERRQIKTDDISVLKNTRIAVDAAPWLRRIMLEVAPAEPYQSAIGGLPMTLLKTLRTELDNFKNAGVKPVFVFGGLKQQRKSGAGAGPSQSEDMRMVKRGKGWQSYYNGKLDEAKNSFAATQRSGFFIHNEFSQHIIQFFRQNDVEFFRAPYLAWAQISYLAHSKQNFVHAVLAGPELLLFNAPRVIIDLDFQKGTFDWVDFNSVLNNLEETPDQFLDTCILAGFDLCGTFPPIADGGFKFTSALDLVKNCGNGINVVQHHLQQSNQSAAMVEYKEAFLRTRTLVRHNLVLETGCVCEPLNKEFCPSDIHEVVGPRLPNEIYVFIGLGIVSPQVINNIAQGVLLEGAPMCDSEEYRLLLDELVDMRTRTLSMIVSLLHEFYQLRSMVTVRWFDHHQEHALRRHAISSVNWKVRDSEVRSELLRQKKTGSQIGLLFILNWQKNQTKNLQKQVESLSVSKSHDDVVTTTEESVCIALLQGLEMREYLNPDHQLSVWGRALAMGSAFEEESTVVLELIKMGRLNGNRLTQPSSSSSNGGNTPSTPSTTSVPISYPVVTEKLASHERDITLLSRVFSLLPMTTKDQPWDSRIDHDLMGFNSIVKALHRSLRNMFEMLMLSYYLQQKTRLTPADYSHVSGSLPFLNEASTAMGIVLKGLFENPTDLPAVEKLFPACISIKQDMQRGLKFWEQVMGMVTFLKDQNNLSAELAAEFESANDYLNSSLKSLITS